jgi:hypothetical protein
MAARHGGRSGAPRGAPPGEARCTKVARPTRPAPRRGAPPSRPRCRTTSSTPTWPRDSPRRNDVDIFPPDSGGHASLTLKTNDIGFLFAGAGTTVVADHGPQLNVDPQLVKKHGIYRLCATSPMINAGTSTGRPFRTSRAIRGRPAAARAAWTSERTSSSHERVPSLRLDARISTCRNAGRARTRPPCPRRRGPRTA